MKTESISFHASKTINIGNFEAVKITYGESITVDPTRDVDDQRSDLISMVYKQLKKQTKQFEGISAIQKIDNNKKRTIIRYAKEKKAK